MTLLARVAAHLDAATIRFGVVGAAALAVHGVSRSTFDIDVLTIDPRVLETAFWEPLRSSAAIDVRRGDAADPLAGVVRLTAPLVRDVDVIVGRSAWQREVLDGTRSVQIDGARVPVVDVAGLTLMKLYAGGSQDAWDIEQLLAANDREQVVRLIDAVIDRLPDASQALWTRLKAE